MSSTLHTIESLSQNPDEMQVALEQLKQFRLQLYSSLAYRGDTIMDLLDALSSNTTAKSVVELSLNPLFRHGYGSIYGRYCKLFCVIFYLTPIISLAILRLALQCFHPFTT